MASKKPTIMIGGSEYISAEEIRDRYQLPHKLILRFLGKPDEIDPAQTRRSQRRLYLWNRVNDAMGAMLAEKERVRQEELERGGTKLDKNGDGLRDQSGRVTSEAKAQASAPPPKAPKYITPTGLRGKRYWTDKMIQDLLGGPDATARNPHYRSAAPMRLYLLSRVDAIESTLDVEAMKQARLKRSAAARRAVATRQKNLEMRIFTINLNCRFDEPLALVRSKAATANEEIAAYHEHEYQAYVERCLARGKKPEPRRGPAHPEVAAEDRWAVNYLRHERSSYDDLLYEFGSWARDMLRRRIHREIAKAYPDLREAAVRMIR